MRRNEGRGKYFMYLKDRLYSDVPHRRMYHKAQDSLILIAPYSNIYDSARGLSGGIALAHPIFYTMLGSKGDFTPSHAFPTRTLDSLHRVRLSHSFAFSCWSHAAQSPNPVKIW